MLLLLFLRFLCATAGVADVFIVAANVAATTATDVVAVSVMQIATAELQRLIIFVVAISILLD